MDVPKSPVVGKRILETRAVTGNAAEIEVEAVVANLREGVERPDGAVAVDKVLDGRDITAALSLAESVDNTAWVHLDMARPRLSTKESRYMVRGAAFGVTTLVGLALNAAKS